MNSSLSNSSGRYLILSCVLALVFAACGDGGSGETASSVPTAEALPTSSQPTAGLVPEMSAWSAVEVDSGGATGQIPTVVVSPDGRLGVVYFRGIATGHDHVEVAWSSCVDAQCTAMTHSTLTSGRLRPAWVRSAGFAPDGLVVYGEAIGAGGFSGARIWACAGPACKSSVETRISADLGEHVPAMGLHAGSEQMPVIGYAVGSGANYEMFVGFCEDSACTSHRPVPVHEVPLGVGFGSQELHVLPDGSPTLFFTTGAEPGQPGRWVVVVCDDPDCSETLVRETDPSWKTNEEPAHHDLPFIVYAEGFEIHRLQCVDAECSMLSERLLHTVTGAEFVGLVRATAVAGKFYVVYQSVDPAAEYGEGEWDHALLVCDDTTCRAVEDLPLTRGHHVAIGHAGEDTLVIAGHSGRPYLCLEECADPNDDLSKLILYFATLPIE